MFIEGVEVVHFDGQHMFTISYLILESLVIYSCIFAAEVMQEIFEEMLNMGVGAFNGVVAGTQVLVRKVDSFTVHSRNL